ncbi:hypothetical protein AVBRAN12654_05685 [Campylobacter sp. RM12654]|uniref:hypothetical protein n=1 Tax=unclassified Campylobacter TaxID=2593542 RepID=UPI001D308CBC|nr:hypothetical protein [Campylobacter sp. RM12654]MBZ7992876.1 hypothetical protein [Campylobacter sp. RM9333]
MKKTLEILKILFKIFIIIEIVIAFYSIFAGVIFSIGSDVNVIYSIIVCFFAANYFIYENLSQIIILFYEGFILYPLIYLKVFIIIFFIILFFKLRKRFNNKIAFKYSIIPMIIIFTLYNYFFRTIPDYSSKTHEKIVTLSDYKKYQQGYCLKEDRILPKDELYKRVVVDDFTKLLVRKDILYKMIYNSITNHEYEIHKDINLDNYKDYLRKNIYSKRYVNYDELEPVDYTKYLVVKNNIVGFTKPIILLGWGASVSISVYTDIAFEFKDNIYRTYSFYLIDEFDEREDKEKEYKYRLRVFNHQLLSYEADIKEKRSYIRKFDNCGYSNFNPEKEAIEIYNGI